MRAAFLVISVLAAAGCAPVSSTVEERMPGPATIWLASEPAAPATAVDVVMTSPDDAGIRFAHTFGAGQAVRGDFATSQGRYTLTALGGACRLPLTLAPNEAADVLLTLEAGAGCTLAVARRGHMDDPAMQKGDGWVLITNHDVGLEPPVIEPGPS